MGSDRLNDISARLRREDRALSLRQLGSAYGLGYVRIKQMQALPGFPLIAGKVIPSDFDQWRVAQSGLSSRRPVNRLRSAVGKARELASRNGLRVSWRQIANTLKASIASHELREGNGSSDV